MAKTKAYTMQNINTVNIVHHIKSDVLLPSDNIRSSFFLPETGGAGTDHLRRKGAGMMLASLFVLIGCFTGGLSGRRRRKEDVKQSRFL